MAESTASREQIEQDIIELIVSEGKIDRSRMTPDATLESLELQSMDTVMILMAIEEKFGVYIPVDGQIAEARDLKTFVRSISDHIIASHA